MDTAQKAGNDMLNVIVDKAQVLSDNVVVSTMPRTESTVMHVYYHAHILANHVSCFEGYQGQWTPVKDPPRDGCSPLRYGATQEYDEMTDEIREDMAKRGRLISRDELNNWLSTEQELLDVMEDAEIDLSCKSDLFDVFDANLDGLLHFDEMVEGMLRCRGPVSKTDIIAVRLKTRLLVRMVTKICEKLDIDTEGLTA